MSRWLACAFVFCCGVAASAQPSIIPAPKSVQMREGSVTLRTGTSVCTDGSAAARSAASYMVPLVAKTRGIRMLLRSGVCADGVTFRLLAHAATPKESYTLEIAPDHGVVISASDAAGLFYGGVTLWQLMTQTAAKSSSATLAAMHIEDAPRLAWRGIMLDSARHVQSTAFVARLIDQMALHKLNVLHWHLTDDQGWRLEIKRYPRLTSVGAWRVEYGPAAAKNIDPKTGKPRRYGGYFTQQQVRYLVAYAAARNVMIVPEIEMPGHETAAIAAYPELGASKAKLAGPSNQWGVHDNLFNLDDSTFTFLENVLTEVMALFPGPYIHVGGDEAVKDQWIASEAVQAKKRELGLKDETALQSYFMQRIGRFLSEHHRKLVGWDEILEGGLADDATVMSWHGVKGGITAADAGHDAVLTPQRPLYFNFRQSDATDEPPGRAPLNTLREVYEFEPAPAATLTPAQRQHIVGVQANLWTEHVRTEDRVEHMLFPRAAALAEVGWSPEQRDWQRFLARLVVQMDRYQALGLPAAESAFEVRTAETLDPERGGVTVALKNQVGFGEIRYTTDGTPVTAQSPVYAVPLNVPLPTDLHAATFVDGRTVGSAVASAVRSAIHRKLDAVSVRQRDSRELQLCTESPALQMEDDAPIDGPRAVFLVNYLNPCWLYKRAALDGIVRLTAAVGQIPFNLKIGKDAKPVLHPVNSAGGELEVFLDKCTGRPLLQLPLAEASQSDGITLLQGAFPAMTGTHDLCITFTRANNDFIWAVQSVGLVPAAAQR